jgi:leader peptidase (prepilin peptidase)/N-methyltransferase
MIISNLLLIFSFILGAAIGSFIDALVYRLREGLPIIAARSICPHCKKQIRNIDLIPILSYFLLKGRCRNCGHPLSKQYPVFEILTGLSFAGTYFAYFGYGAGFDLPTVFSFAAQLFFVTVLLILLLYDLRYMELPDRVVLPAIAAALVIDILKIALGVWQFHYLTGRLPFGRDLLLDESFVWGHTLEIIAPIVFGLLAGIVLAGVFYAIVYLSKERAMGGGDIKLAILLGLILPWPYLLPALYIGFALGAIVGVALVILQRKKMRQLIPLAPFLVAGTLASMFFGDFLYRYLLTFRLF